MKKYKLLIGGRFQELYTINNIDEFMKLYNQHMIKFPFKKIYISTSEVKEMFEYLKKYDPNLRMKNIEYKLRYFDNKFLGKPTIITINNDEDYIRFNQLSDYFQEINRMKCTIKNKISPYKAFHNPHIIKKIAERVLTIYGEITPYNLREQMFCDLKECTSHRPNIIITIAKLFSSKSILDISAGWGDRLLGAMALEADYFSTDPNPRLHDGYNEMIKMFGKSDFEKYKILDKPFEQIELDRSRNFDLVFTSPPYFDYEIYNTTDINQSITYSTEKIWFDKFLSPSIQNAWDALVLNGIMAINIAQFHDNSYVNWMHEQINSYPNSKYLGVISYANTDLDNPQPIWIWKKK